MHGRDMSPVEVGDAVRIIRSGSPGIVQEVRPARHLVRVTIKTAGVDRWLRWETVDAVLPWYLRKSPSTDPRAGNRGLR